MKVVDSGQKSAALHMAQDAHFLAHIEEPLLHFYEFVGDAATFGYFLKPESLFQMEEVERVGLDLARRPTGGGMVFHLTDFTFSFLIPASHPAFSLNPLDNYLFINQQVERVLVEAFQIDVELLPQEEVREGDSNHFCMAKPTKYDLLVRGLKVGGAAQRKTQQGYLHQASILLGQLPFHYLQAILKDKSVAEMIYKSSFALLGTSWSDKELQDAKNHLKNTFIKKIGSYA